MMLYPSMNELLKRVPNRYSLVNVAAKRARDIAAKYEGEGAEHLTEKAVSLALDDIISGRIVPVETHHDEDLGMFRTAASDHTFDGAADFDDEENDDTDN